MDQTFVFHPSPRDLLCLNLFEVQVFGLSNKLLKFPGIPDPARPGQMFH